MMMTMLLLLLLMMMMMMMMMMLMMTFQVRPRLASGALFGVFFGDELAWRCVTWDNITAMVDTVRADLPRGQVRAYMVRAQQAYHHRAHSFV